MTKLHAYMPFGKKFALLKKGLEGKVLCEGLVLFRSIWTGILFPTKVGTYRYFQNQVSQV